MSRKKQLAKNTMLIFIGKIFTQMISFFLLPLYTKKLLTEEYGLVDLITTYITLLVPIITLQLESAAFRFLVDVREDKKEKKKIITNVFFCLFIMIGIFIPLYILVVSIWPIQYQFLILAEIIICIFSSLLLQIARGLGKNLEFAIGSIVSGSINVIMNILLILVFDMKVTGMLVAMIIANLSVCIFLTIKLKIWKFIDRKSKNKNKIKQFLRYSIPLIPNGISWWVVNASDRTIISIFLGKSANGIYAIANKFPSVLSTLIGIFSLSWTEMVSLHINDKDRDSFLSDMFNMALKVFTSIALILIAFMPFLFPIFVNQQYADSYQYIPILVIACICNVAVVLYSGIYIAKKMTKQVAITSIISAVINIGINFLFVRYIGLYAAAFSTLISYLVMAINRHYHLKKDICIQYEKKLFLKTFLMFSISIYFYYINNIYWNIANILLVGIYSIWINRNNILEIIGFIKNKLGSLNSKANIS